MMPARLAWAVPALLALGACTTPPESVAALPADARPFAGMSCDKLAAERARLASEFNTQADNQAVNANLDAGMVAGGALLAWPMLIGLAFTKSHADDMGRLHSQYDGATATAQAQGCMPRPPAPPVQLGGDPAQCSIAASGTGTNQSRAMTTRNSGAWCADLIAGKGSNGVTAAFGKVTLYELPRNGDVELVALPDRSGHVAVYRPNPGFTGGDSFSVAGRADIEAPARFRYTVSVTAP
jgi:hypothetical protein